MRVKHVLMYPEGGDGGGGGGGGVQPAAAREFVAQFVHDPKALEGMQDADVVAYHGRVTTALDKVRPPAASAEKWRETAATGADGKVDDAMLKRLARYTDPKAAFSALSSLQERINSGDLRSSLPKDATPEAIAEYRKSNGIPEAPDKYDLKLRDGLVVGEADKPFVQAFLDKVHGKHVSNEQASAFVEAYYDILGEQEKAAAERHAKMKTVVTDQLNKDWGAEFRPNMNRIASMLDARVADPKLRELIQGGIATNAGFAKLLEGLAREANPAAALLPEGVTADIGNLDSEIRKIEDVIRTDRAKYDRDVGMQDRYRQLLGAKDQMARK